MSPASLRAVVLTVDQRGSRRSDDAVPAALALLADVEVLRPWERTAGDEMQAVLDSPASVTAAIERLVRDGRWHVGVGIGGIEAPLPDSTRAGRGEAYVAARAAVGAARTAPHHLRVEGDNAWCRHLESALWLWAGVLERRSPKGWEVVDLLAAGTTYEHVGATLGISQSAVSQRAAAAGVVEAGRAADLATFLTAHALETA
ncbi:transposase [Nocardioides jishulii]|uniref:Transposase n=1 Tax=Nocardioides jishulii TaxID=2575440 RepID=A0A4U2YKZ5_9ACTN|nr:transposase [Nocardioides jishulii]QCX27096.1 transposase [Nocardioides jishulii]TKI61580.1 transposase [Nocardioides jishulii]